MAGESAVPVPEQLADPVEDNEESVFVLPPHLRMVSGGALRATRLRIAAQRRLLRSVAVALAAVAVLELVALIYLFTVGNQYLALLGAR